MAAFSYHHHHPFLLDNSIFLQNPPMKTSIEKPNDTNSYSSQFYQLDDPLEQILMVRNLNENSSLEDVIKPCLSHNEPSVTNNKHSSDSSSVVGKDETGEKVTQKVIPLNKKRKYKNDSSLFSSQTKTPAKQVKEKKPKKCNAGMNDADKKQPRAYDKDKKVEKKTPEKAPTEYIHVRARRGQATDSHSIAERVRREKISERMKLLQALVPGCDKVTGKAHMLDEIINYVQSLQNQVEFLSMKLASINPIEYDFGMDSEALILTPESLTSIVPPLPNVQNFSLTQPSTISGATNNFSTGNNYPLLDTSYSQLFQQGKMPITPPQFQGEGQLLWNMNDQIQKFINQSDFSNNLHSFH